MKLKVSDGQLFSLTRVLTIQMRSNDPMAVVSKGSFMAKVGLDTQLDSSILDVQSETSAYPVTVSVLEGERKELLHTCITLQLASIKGQSMCIKSFTLNHC